MASTISSAYFPQPFSELNLATLLLVIFASAHLFRLCCYPITSTCSRRRRLPTTMMYRGISVFAAIFTGLWDYPQRTLRFRGCEIWIVQQWPHESQGTAIA